MHYIIIFIITAILLYFSESKKKKTINRFFLIVGLLLPILMATFRDLRVGTDTNLYIKLDFERAMLFDNFTTYLKSSQNEISYLIINYIITRFTNNIHVIFFVFQTIIVLLMYKISYNYKELAPKYFIFSILLATLYNKSLNMLRQTISMLIVFDAINDLSKNKNKVFIFKIILAMTFHKTAVIALVFFPFKYVYKNKNRVVYFYFALCSLILFIVNFTNIVSILVNFNIIENRYLYYIQNSTINVSTTLILLKSCIIILLLYFVKFFKKQNKENEIYFFYSIVNYILYFSGCFFNYFERFSYYFEIFYILLIIQIPNIFKENKAYSQLLIFIIMLIYSYIVYGILKIDQTVPYTSSILNIF